MTEDFLHFIWRTRNFNIHNLRTTEGLVVEILDFGQWNTNAGPDFLMARVVIGGMEWAGNIEMHLVSSAWTRHGHTHDPSYESVILHVVMEEDIPAYAGERRIPCVELRDRIDGSLLGRYQRLLATASWVPCAGHLHAVPALTKQIWLDRMLVERLESRISLIDAVLDETRNNWEEVFYRNLASAYGFKINAAPFSRIARLLPLRYIYQHQDSLMQIEAMLYGTAGMLNRIFVDDYPVALQKEYLHLSAKYNLQAIDAHAWNWGRLRPANFPTIRISQFAGLLCDFQGLFRAVLESSDVNTLRALFMTSVSLYWTTHIDFDKTTRASQRKIGQDSIDRILINTIVPFLFCYGRRHGDDRYTDHALDSVAALPSEINVITRHWEKLDMLHQHAGHSQALMHLKKTYCDQRHCVACAIGNSILTPTQNS